MAQQLSDDRQRPQAPGCLLLEDLKTLRQLEGAMDIIETHELHAERNARGFPFGLHVRGRKTIRADWPAGHIAPRPDQG